MKHPDSTLGLVDPLDPAEGQPRFRRPSRRSYRSEPPRAALELARFLAAYPVLAGPSGGPAGDGHAVLVLPGFMAGDESTRTLRRLLIDRGYEVEAWGLGRNIGPTPRVLASLDPMLARLHERSGRAVSIIGWSLGGIYARGLAARHPALVRNVIVMGCPMRLSALPDHTRLTNAGRLYRAMGRRHSTEDWLPPQVLDAPPPVPCTSLYSMRDGVVPWRACLEFEGPQAESIDVGGSHCGMGHNIDAIPVLLDRVAQPKEQWQPWAAPRPLLLAAR